MQYARKPCDECPWRMDVAPGKFSPDRFIALAPCSYDMGQTVFACHKSPEGREFACAGFLLMSGAHNFRVRMAMHAFDVSSSYPMFPTYRAMAIANGVKRNDPALSRCRDDAQMEIRNEKA